MMQQAAALHAQGRRAEAIEAFQQVLALTPEVAEGWYELGYLQKAEGRYQEALDAYARALQLGIRRPEEVHLNRAVIFSDHLRRDDDAQRELSTALELAPHYLPARLNLGNLWEERGERERALECYAQAVNTPGQSREDREFRAEALARSANLQPPASADDPLFDALQRALDGLDQGSKIFKANLLFSIGRARDRLGDRDQAFDAYAMANRALLRQSGRTYDPGRATSLVDAIIDTFKAGEPSPPDAVARPGAAPLFICGMFRSGSTLVEQVLAAHPQVTPGGELNYLLRLVSGELAPYPASLAGQDPALFARLAAGYLGYLSELFPNGIDGTYITDKRPDNFLLIGLIKRLFPNARIIHTTRNPLDTGLSIFMQHLDLRVAAYASDLGDIGHYYGQYRRLMAHWHAVYPDSILDFDYDDFVAEPRPALERLLTFVDLPWDERCLAFHKLGNTVKTASYWQIRQPLTNTASGRWRGYEQHLTPLRKSLLDAGVALPA